MAKRKKVDEFRLLLMHALRNNGFEASIRKCDCQFNWTHNELKLWTTAELAELNSTLYDTLQDKHVKGKFKTMCHTVRERIVKVRIDRIHPKVKK